MLTVSALHAAYGRVPTLMGIDLTIREGEFLGILGHNGMGRTTLMPILMGFMPAMAGRVTLPGRDIGPLKPHERARLSMAA